MKLATIRVPIDHGFMLRADVSMEDFVLTVKSSLPPGSEVLEMVGWLEDESLAVDWVRLLVVTR